MTQDLADRIADLWVEAIQEATTSTERALQQADFRLGMSDLGHCHEYARRMIKQEPFSDERDKTAAFLGSVIGEGVESALHRKHPDWLFQQEIVTTLPSGLRIPGHPDVIDPTTPLVADNKTKDGFEVIKKMGHTQQQRFQKHGYAAGCIQAGLVPEEGLMVANVYIDRSGSEIRPYVIAEPYDPGVLEEIDAWIEDVLYAVRNDEESSRDMPRDWCERFCEYFSSCRLYDTDVTGLLEAPDVLSAIEVYEEGKALEKEGKKKKDQAKTVLEGVVGHTPTHTLRWIEIGATTIPETHRAGYARLDLRARTVKK